ncbi:type 1 fimbrial minor subunit FimG [Erwinia tasmaniensis]|uniref:Minor fimbrial subunit, FimG n=1 Tax=Erwinia tasmaniensis (strain DSM 17950 / CFBP 7177 / CIP 109463 / NCPPB 4357 / Et1/99) TaxID=465817 RepID=B2VEY8_ERWT9|nr:Minor fimbrial subunit, FimG [Erwinia tasmaniensis Et1/99]
MTKIKCVLLAGMLIFTTMPGAHAADVTITVNGRVVAKPCTVSTPSAAVNLGDLFTFNYVQAGSGSAWYPVTLNLTNCPTGTSRVTATFTGTTDSTGYYKNQGGATNLQLELQDTDGNNLNNGKKKAVQVDDSSQSASLPLQVRALSVNGNAKQGSIQAVINVTYTYA